MRIGPIIILGGLVWGVLICYRRGHLGTFRFRKQAIEKTPDPWTDKMAPPVGVW
jgi:hypothetical protein